MIIIFWIYRDSILLKRCYVNKYLIILENLHKQSDSISKF